MYRITQQGNLISTKNTYDLAIEGKGFFKVELPNGDTGYTRAGSFQLSAEGVLVTTDGYTIEPTLTIPDKPLERSRMRSHSAVANFEAQWADKPVPNFADTPGATGKHKTTKRSD